MKEDIEALLAWIEGATHGELKGAWKEYCPDWVLPKKTSVQFLRLAIAWKAQEQVFGGLSDEVLTLLSPSTKLAPSSKPKANVILPGTILRRDWRGDLYEVVAIDDGFSYEGETFGSLSEIARQITGTRWNGPAFFGLRSRPKQLTSKFQILEVAE